MEKGEARSGIESELESEINAQLAEEVLGNEAFINKLVRSETSLAEKIMAKIHDLMDAFQSLANKEARAEYNRLQKAEKLYLKAVEGAGWKYVKGEIEKAIGEQEDIDKGSEVEYALKKIENTDLIQNAKMVIQMESVSELTGKEFSSDGKTSLKDRVVSFFESFGNEVYNPDLGDVAVTTSSFRDDKGHGLTYNKVVSFAAIPEVISNGKIIDVWKPEGKPYTRITVSAPIMIAGEKYYMGVMIQRDNQNQRMYLHDVITEKATLSFTTEPTARDGEGIRDKGHLFITSILQKALNVKSDEQNNSGNIRYSMKDPISDEIERERNFNYSEGQEAKADANVNRKKVYTKQDAQQIVSAVLAGHMNFGEAYGNLLGKSCTVFLMVFFDEKIVLTNKRK